MTSRYKVNAPRVIHETLDGEVVAIDLASGAYFSMRGTGAVIWDAVAAGLDTDTVVEHVRATHDTGDADVSTDVKTFVEDLVVRELIVAGDGEAPRDVPDPGTGLDYTTPEVEAYTDMADVILLDPVHDVDASAGWPHRPAESDHAETDTAAE